MKITGEGLSFVGGKGRVTEAARGLAEGLPQSQGVTAPPQLRGQGWGQQGHGLG